ncbi:IS1-like element transposase [Pectobacterium araliae]
MNGAGVKDTGRVLKISMNTVMSTLKNSRRDK